MMQMPKLAMLIAALLLASCASPAPETDVAGSVSVGPNGVRPNVGLRVGNVRFGRNGLRIGLPR